MFFTVKLPCRVYETLSLASTPDPGPGRGAIANRDLKQEFAIEI